MKIYISYSLGLTDLHIASRLAREAEAKGITVLTSYQPTAPATWSLSPMPPILAADAVIAIATKDSRNITNFSNDLQTAVSYRKPVLALVEKGILGQSSDAIQYIEFDRRNLGGALAQINTFLESRKNQQNTNQWLVAGGLALLALYLFGDKK
jgi:hypothetical protein